MDNGGNHESVFKTARPGQHLLHRYYASHYANADGCE
jgi:hypothetical protein